MNMLKVKDYTMILFMGDDSEDFSELKKFCDSIREKIKKGYILFGKTTVNVETGFVVFTQAMVLLDDPERSQF